MRSPLLTAYTTPGWLIPSRSAVPCEIDVNHTEVYPVYPVASANGTGLGSGNRTGAYLTRASPAYYSRAPLRPNNKINLMLPLFTFPVVLLAYFAPPQIPAYESKEN